MVNEFSVQVLFASLHLAFVLGIGWVGKVSLDTVLSAPSLLLLLELLTVVG